MRERTAFEQIIETVVSPYKKEVLASKACEVRALIQPLWAEETLPELEIFELRITSCWLPWGDRGEEKGVNWFRGSRTKPGTKCMPNDNN